MSNYNLTRSGNKEIQRSFAYEVVLAPDANLGLNDELGAWVTDTDLPTASSEIISVFWAGGAKSHYSGKRVVKPINIEFNLSADYKTSAIQFLEKWGRSTFSLEDGTNQGKSIYAYDGFKILLKGNDGRTLMVFRLLKAQPDGEMSYGTVNSEGNEVLKANMTLIYDDYRIEDESGNLLRDTKY